MTSSILLATFIVVFTRIPFTLPIALALLGFVLVVEGLPAWGSDVGGVLAAVCRRSCCSRSSYASAGSARSSSPCLRPRSRSPCSRSRFVATGKQRAHLGRLVERVNDDGLSPLYTIVERKFVAAIRRVDALGVDAHDPDRNRADRRARPRRQTPAADLRERISLLDGPDDHLRRGVPQPVRSTTGRDRRWHHVLHAHGPHTYASLEAT